MPASTSVVVSHACVIKCYILWCVRLWFRRGARRPHAISHYWSPLRFSFEERKLLQEFVAQWIVRTGEEMLYNVFPFLFCIEIWSLDIKNYMRWIISITISESGGASKRWWTVSPTLPSFLISQAQRIHDPQMLTEKAKAWGVWSPRWSDDVKLTFDIKPLKSSNLKPAIC